jgi:hypothetical protein
MVLDWDVIFNCVVGTHTISICMFKYLIALTLAVLCITASAQKPIESSKKVVCYPLNVMLKDLKDKYGEEPMVMGIEGTMADVGMGLYINKDTGSYTVIEFDKEAACVISVGKNVRYRFPKQGLAL